jgi:thiazole/oxazole-forming peptide maturase SagD family component
LTVLAPNVEMMLNGPALRLRNHRVELSFTFHTLEAAKAAGAWLQGGGAAEQLDKDREAGCARDFSQALDAQGMLSPGAAHERNFPLSSPSFALEAQHACPKDVLVVGLNDAGVELAFTFAQHRLQVADFQNVHRGDVGLFYAEAQVGTPRLKAFLDRVGGQGVEPVHSLAGVLASAKLADLVLLSLDHASPKLMMALARATKGHLLVLDVQRDGCNVYLQPPASETCVGCVCAHRAARDAYVAAALSGQPEVTLLQWRHHPSPPQLQRFLEELTRLPTGGPTLALDVESGARSVVRPHPRCACRQDTAQLRSDENRPTRALAELEARLAGYVDAHWGTLSDVMLHPRATGDRSRWRLLNVDPSRCEVAALVAATALAPVAGTQPSYIRGDALKRDPREARALAMIECLERLFTLVHPPAADVQSTPWTQLVAAAVPPAHLALFTPAQLAQIGFPYAAFDEETPLDWLWAECLQDGSRRLLPRQCVGVTREPRVLPRTSNGAAAHSNYTCAVLNAVLELVERDALLGCWLKQSALPKLADTETLMDRVPFARSLQRLGFTIQLMDATADCGVPVLMATFEDQHNPDLFTLNAASGRDAAEALDKLCREFVLLWRAYLEGDPLAEQRPLEVEDVRNLDDHLLFHQSRSLADSRSFLRASMDTRLSSDMPWPLQQDPAAQLRTIVQNLTARNLELLVVDCTPTWLREELTIVKAIVPGLIPLYASVVERPLALARLQGDSALNPFPHPFC